MKVCIACGQEFEDYHNCKGWLTQEEISKERCNLNPECEMCGKENYSFSKTCKNCWKSFFKWLDSF